MEQAVKQALEEVKPFLAQHAGSIEFVGVKDGVVKVRMLGACSGCGLASLTLKAGIEELLREKVPQVERVEAVE